MFAIHHGDMGQQKAFLHPAHLPRSIWSYGNCFDSEPPVAYGEKSAPEVKLKVEAGPRPQRTPCLLPASRTGVGVCVTVSLIMKILYLVWDAGA